MKQQWLETPKGEEQWWLFTRTDSGLPMIVTSRFVDANERADRPHAVTAHVQYSAQPNGLPAKGELDKACRIEDKIIAELQPRGAIHVGHVTWNGSLKVVLYTREKPPAAITVKTGVLGKRTIKLDSRLDEQWNVYEHELAPTPQEQEESNNRQLLSTLAGHGDDHSKSRPVDFAARFPSANARSAFMDAAATEGFRPSGEPTWEPAEDEFWCELVKDTSIEPDAIGAQTALLRSLAAKHGGEFDGWACPVAK